MDGESLALCAELVGYNTKDLKTVLQASILGDDCGAPLKFADIQRGERVVYLGFGAGIDAFIAANIFGKSGNVRDDMTDEIMARLRRNEREAGYTYVEFKKGHIEERTQVMDNSIDHVISNCFINLTTDKIKTFKEVKRILKPGFGMLVSDMVADRILPKEAINLEKWSGCIDGALPKDYIDSIRKTGAKNVQVLNDQLYIQGEEFNGMKISNALMKVVED